MDERFARHHYGASGYVEPGKEMPQPDLDNSARVRELEAEIARLNKWADGFSDAQLRERQSSDALIKELLTENKRLKEELLAEQTKRHELGKQLAEQRELTKRIMLEKIGLEQGRRDEILNAIGFGYMLSDESLDEQTYFAKKEEYADKIMKGEENG